MFGPTQPECLHTEYMVDMDGAFSLNRQVAGMSVINGTRFNLSDVGVIYRRSKDEVRVGWVGDLASGTESDLLEFKDANTTEQISSFWYESDGFLSAERICQSIWKKNLSGTPTEITTVTVGQLLNFSEFADRTSRLRTAIQRQQSANSIESIFETALTFEEFVTIYSMIDDTSGTNVGRVFDSVVKRLALEVGEVRLIGATKEPVGRHGFPAKIDANPPSNTVRCPP